jgi:D-alanyl-D-alanine carboxypeptidase/D-alanyl-D-alanine-endopeptidase (penicillin-binding protein 4)
VPLQRGECSDWRQGLQADFSAPERISFSGRYLQACGEREWPVAFGDPARFNARALLGLWKQLGGTLGGQVREGRLPAGLPVLTELISPTLPEVVRDMNKHSNNLIAQQIFFSLSLAARGTGRVEASRELMQARLAEKAGCGREELQIDRGSGLSRQERITAACMGRVLRWAWASPWMPELLASLPVAGIETTARRAVGAAGRAHLKTGSINGVAALAGYVHREGGRRDIVVAIVNHPLAGTAESRAALDAVIRWALEAPDRRP